MTPYRRALPGPWLWYCLLLFTVVTLAASTCVADSVPATRPAAINPSRELLARRGFESFYNSEYDKAIRDFEALSKAHPDNPFATNYLLTGVMFKELYRIGALDTESYANDSFLNKKTLRPVDPEARKRVLALIEKALQEEEALLKEHPADVDALYARGSTRALRSTWMAMAEKAWFAGLRSALAARSDNERVLQLDPKYIDAKMVLGIHNYVIGSLNWAAKVAMSLAGVTGNRQKGLEYLREVSRSDCVASMDAKIALALFLRREQKYDEALAVVKGMTDAYPKNYLAAVEYANLLNAAGRGPEAIAAYRKILAWCKEGKYPTSQPELAALGLGISLRGQRDFRGAAQAFEMVSGFATAEKELAQRAELAAGEMYDTVREREAAMKKYQQVIAMDRNAPQAELARKHMKQAYRYE